MTTSSAGASATGASSVTTSSVGASATGASSAGASATTADFSAASASRSCLFLPGALLIGWSLITGALTRPSEESIFATLRVG